MSGQGAEESALEGTDTHTHTHTQTDAETDTHRAPDYAQSGRNHAFDPQNHALEVQTRREVHALEFPFELENTP